MTLMTNYGTLFISGEYATDFICFYVDKGHP
nr:MAG TPA: hypothetical protein [Caudoviricetes sp.]